jgi:uncharacterized coiled-coil DUF342 family protein
MSKTPESDKAKIAFTSLFANDDAYWVPFKVSCKLERERDEALSDLEFRRDLFKLQEQQLNDVRAERDRLAEVAERYRLEANAMMMQRDELVEAVREAWLVMDDVEGMDKLDDWQNKYTKYIEGTLI